MISVFGNAALHAMENDRQPNQTPNKIPSTPSSSSSITTGGSSAGVEAIHAAIAGSTLHMLDLAAPHHRIPAKSQSSSSRTTSGNGQESSAAFFLYLGLIDDDKYCVSSSHTCAHCSPEQASSDQTKERE